MAVSGAPTSVSGSQRLGELRAIPLFGGCTDRELAAINGLVADDAFGPGEVLVRDSVAGGRAFVIVEGTAEVLVGTRRVDVVGPGEVVGEMAIVDGRHRSVTVRAVTDVAVLAVEETNLGALFDHEAAARQAMRNLRLPGAHARLSGQITAKVSSNRAVQVFFMAEGQSWGVRFPGEGVVP